MPKKRSPRCLQKLSLQAFGKVILNACKTHAKNNCESESNAVLCIQDIFSNLPFLLVDDVFCQVVTQLEDVFGCPNHDETFGKIDDVLNIMCDSRVRHLSFVNICEKFHVKIIDRLHCMTGLRYLELVWMECKDSTAIVVGVTLMKNLTEFRHWYCADEIVTALAHNCKSLQILDVCRSEDVSDVSMMDVQECKALRYLDIGGTSVSSSGCAAVLRSVPELRKLAYWRFSDVLKELQESGPMNLEVIIGYVDVSKLSLLHKLFPCLQEISLDLRDGALDHDVIPVFTRLRSLEIINRDVDYNILYKILDTNGVFITHLVLGHIQFLRVDIIKTVAKCCLALTDLEIKHCNYEKQPHPSTSRFLNVSKFQNLKALRITNTDNNIEDVLPLSPDITVLELVYVPNVTGDEIVNIIKKYPLKYLREFHIYLPDEHYLRVAIVYNILQLYGSLLYLKCCAKFTEAELRDLQMYITNKNLKVHIYTYTGQEV